VIVRKDLICSSQAVQAGHAVSEFCINSDLAKSWNNNVLIYLEVENMKKLEWVMFKLEKNNLKYYCFKEPDNNNEITSISVLLENNKFFKNLKLL
jgi:hypothetical protein